MARENTDQSLDALPWESHPLGTGVGAAGGAIAGAALGAVGGPAGALVGGLLGAVAGVFAGRGVAELAHPSFPEELYDQDLGNGPAQAINHDLEDAYWREAHAKEPYYNPDRRYGDYAPAYRMGWVSRARYGGGAFEQYEPAFRNDWDFVKGESRLDWEEAKHAVKAGWQRIERTLHTKKDSGGQ